MIWTSIYEVGLRYVGYDRWMEWNEMEWHENLGTKKGRLSKRRMGYLDLTCRSGVGFWILDFGSCIPACIIVLYVPLYFYCHLICIISSAKRAREGGDGREGRRKIKQGPSYCGKPVSQSRPCQLSNL